MWVVQGNLAKKSAPWETHRNGVDRSWATLVTGRVAGRPGATWWSFCVQILFSPRTSCVTLGRAFNLLSLLVLKCKMEITAVMVKMRMKIGIYNSNSASQSNHRLGVYYPNWFCWAYAHFWNKNGIMLYVLCYTPILFSPMDILQMSFTSLNTFLPSLKECRVLSPSHVPPRPCHTSD